MKNINQEDAIINTFENEPESFDEDIYWEDFLKNLDEYKRISLSFWWVYSIALVIMLYVTYKLIKLTKCRNIRIMLLAICIILTLIAHMCEDIYYQYIKLS